LSTDFNVREISGTMKEIVPEKANADIDWLVVTDGRRKTEDGRWLSKFLNVRKGMGTIEFECTRESWNNG
jgi:hypothetical protein